MPNRILAESIVWDEHVQMLSPQAFMLYVKLIVMADDFGIGPAKPTEMAGLVRWPNTSRASIIALSRNFEEITRNGLVREISHGSKRVYVIKPDSWDKIQWRMISKRTCSKSLGEDSERADEIRRAAWATPNGSLENDSRNFLESRGISSHARASSPPLSEKESIEITPEEIQNSEQKEQVEILQPTPDTPAPIGIPVSTTRIGEIITTFRRIADRVGLPDDRFPVSEVGWTSDLHRAGQQFGYACLVNQARKFEVWFVDLCEKKPQEKLKKHRPKVRFLNTWMGNVNPDEFTTGDDNMLPTGPAASPFDNLLHSHA